MHQNLHALYVFMRSRTTTSLVRKPGPGLPSSSIQHSRGSDASGTSKTDVERDRLSRDRFRGIGDRERESCRLEPDDREDGVELDPRDFASASFAGDAFEEDTRCLLAFVERASDCASLRFLAGSRPGVDEEEAGVADLAVTLKASGRGSGAR